MRLRTRKRGGATIQYELINPINEEYSAIEQVLTNRGFQRQDIQHYLNVTEDDNLSSSLLANIDSAAKMLMKHISDPNSVIALIVDSDFDGYSSSALMLNYIHARWPSAIDKITYILHDKKIHGIEVDKLPENTTLVLVPDASSNEYSIHQELAEKGIDILILDHHHADTVSEYACVVNNQLCDYPTKSLCGCGIVYKLCQYIDELLGEQGFSDQWLDIVATSLIGDMMDMRDFETHYLTQKGLASFRNPFIAGMADKNAYSMGNTITPHGVAFYIVPLVNAITRVGTIEEKTILFESMLEWKAYNLVPSTKRGHKPGDKETVLAQCLRVCTNVKNKQTRMQDAAVEFIEKKIEKENLLDHQILLIQLDEASFDRGITGLIANKIMAKYQRPTLLTVKSEQDGQIVWSGSGRGPGRCELEDFRGFCEQSGLVKMAQG